MDMKRTLLSAASLTAASVLRGLAVAVVIQQYSQAGRGTVR
jgi:hypothetical protein